jgi:hypothetical protein
MQIEVKDYMVEYEDIPEMHKKVFDAVLNYFKKHHAFHGEVIMQCDNTIIDAPNVLSNIADNIMKFKVTYKED